jgi:transposase
MWGTRRPGRVPEQPAEAKDECPRCGGQGDWEGRVFVCIDCGHRFDGKES